MDRRFGPSARLGAEHGGDRVNRGTTQPLRPPFRTLRQLLAAVVRGAGPRPPNPRSEPFG